MGRLLRLVWTLDCHLLLLFLAGTYDTAREMLSVPGVTTGLWGSGGVCGAPGGLVCEDQRLEKE